MMNTYSIDYETTSSCNIKHGGYRYASDPSTRILMFAIARNDEEPILWDHLDPNSPESVQAKGLLEEADSTDCEVHAFNAAFEVAITRYRLYEDVGMSPICHSKWRCVQALARVASLPVSLANVATFLRVEDKDPVGKALINVFSDKNKQITLRSGKSTMKVSDPLALNPIPWSHTMTLLGKQVSLRDAWAMFKDYCRKDVIVERQVRTKLARFALSESELAGFRFTLRMNDMGAPLNVTAINHAAAILATHRQNLETRFKSLTGLAPSQTSKTLEWLVHHGYPADNLQSKTMNQWTGSSFLDSEGREALAIRSDLSFAAIKKIATMQNTVCPDGTAKGMFTWYGASATGRWTSQGIQLQNARKPTITDPDMAYRLICDGADAELMEICFGNPYEAVASCIRNFIQPHEGVMYAVDYSNIESRVAAWLAGQEDLLDVYREGRDAYKELASKVFNVTLQDVTKDQRFVGKVGNLSLVFQTGAKTFHETCAMWGNPISKKVACDTVKTFREVNHHFPKTWRAYEAASVKAIQNPGKWFDASPYVSFACSAKAPFHRLVMRLPSGRQLCYPIPKVERTIKRHTDYETGETREWESDDITYYGQRAGHVAWGRVNLYSGLLFQNSVQATARDIMQHGCVNASSKGYEIFSVIHDEVLSYEHPDGWEGLSAALCEHPAWLPDTFPVAATGGIYDYYTKD
jgi:DNA polymerase